MRFLDAIGRAAADLVAPGAVARHECLREIRGIAGRYEGAKKSRVNADWITSIGSADEDTIDDLPTLRERSRDLVRNDPLAAGLLTTLTDNIVGRGFRPQPRADAERMEGVTAKQAEEWNAKASEAWDRFSETSDIQERTDFPGQLRALYRSAFESGDAFPHFLFRERRSAPYALGLEILEADHVATPRSKLTDRTIKAGVKIGLRGEPFGFYVHRRHPGSHGIAGFMSADEPKFIRRINPTTKRPNLVQFYFPTRPGQNRGVPYFAPALPLFKHLGTLIESEVVATRVASCIAGVIKRTNPLNAALRRSRTNEQGQKLETMEPGVFEYLDPGEDIELLNPQRPGSTFDGFLERIIRMICRSVNLPYELGALDYQRTNFSSTKAALLEARRTFLCLQLTGVRFCRTVYAMVIEEAWLRGDLIDLDFDLHREELLATEWNLAGWGWIDPQKEVAASALAISEGLSTRAQEVQNYSGRDWLEVAEQNAREVKKIRELADKHGNTDQVRRSLAGVPTTVPQTTLEPGAEPEPEDTTDPTDGAPGQPTEQPTEPGAPPVTEEARRAGSLNGCKA